MLQDTNAYLKSEEVCAKLNIHRATFNRWRADNPSFPKPIKFGRIVRWDMSEIIEWLKAVEGAE